MGILSRFFGSSVRRRIESSRSGVSQMLALFLFERYAEQHDGDEALALAAAVTNELFGLAPTNDVGRTFLATHRSVIDAALRDIKNEPHICSIVSVFTYMLGNVAGNSGTFSPEMLQTAVRLQQLGILLPTEQIRLPTTAEDLEQQAQDFEQWIIERSKTQQSPGVFLLSYAFCYQGLPKILFANPTGVISALQKDGFAALQTHISRFLQDYVRAMPSAAPHIPKDFSSLFALEIRQIDASLSIAAISYPAPPKHPVELQPGKPILAPYFTAVAFNPLSPDKFHCFALGQNPNEGTTLRSVSGENMHGNCGVGCRPALEEFLNLVLLVEREGIEAAWKRYAA